ncbi:D-inositol-3-phosphate glycosyltransferase [Candidatus Tiddalikarchaeum anstoanum]|nr:D-inositol-3-phosphate glycosyltransferase [Candidatus Tiddalikarchaeum anstoanum]
MKVLNFVSRNFYPDCKGGCEKVFYELYKKAEKEFKIRIISGYTNNDVFPKDSSVFKHLKTKNALIRYIYYTWNMSLRNLFNKCDLVHANNIECIRLSKTPFVLTIHHVGHFIDPNIRKQTLINKFLGRVLVWQANRADKVITVSNGTMNDLVKMGVKKEKIKVIPNGVDLEKFKPYARSKHNKFIISHVSRISPEKGQDFLIKAFNTLPKNVQKMCELRIIGYVSDEEYYNNLEKGDGIKYYINIPEKELPRLIGESDLVVFPTMMSEGFGLVVLEGMACGVPVLASDQPAIKEAGGEVCQYFKQGDIKDFIEKIMKLYNNKKLREDLSRKGLVWVKKFSWVKVYEEHKKLYAELLKK